MSRNGSGTMSIPNTLVSGTPISASDHNENYSDIATELTNSVAVDGQSTMTGQFKGSSGTVAAPGIAFGADTDSGVYRIGSNNLGVAVGGVKAVDISSTGAAITGAISATGDITATGLVKQGGFSLLPVGVVLPYGGSSAPTGYLLCDGSSKLRASYPDLFTAIGTTYGAADGTHFNVPDMGGRVPAGKESAATRLTSTYFGGDSTALGAVGGLESAPLSLAQLPTGITSANTGAINLTVNSTPGNVASGSGNTSPANPGITQGVTGFGGIASTGSIAIGGVPVTSNNTSGTSHKNVQPTIILNYIIFAGV